jgi:hypothetical protein
MEFARHIKHIFELHRIPSTGKANCSNAHEGKLTVKSAKTLAADASAQHVNQVTRVTSQRTLSTQYSRDALQQSATFGKIPASPWSVGCPVC